MLIPLPPELDVRRQACLLYWTGWSMAQLSELFPEVPEPTLRTWKSRDDWDGAPSIRRVEACIEAKLMQLVLKEPKSGADVRDVDLLARQIERLARVRRYEQPGGHDGDLRPAIESRNAGARKKPTRNAFTEEQVAQLASNLRERMFGYQATWWANRTQRSRGVIKSRQIGATYYFAFEAFVDALLTGKNKVFLSASKNQAHIFRSYICHFAAEVGVELVGDPLVLNVVVDGEVVRSAELYFLGTNYRTAQGYHGDLYIDEFFWIFGFAQLQKVASGMAMHKQWTKTYFSTPSSVTHEAYAWWTGDEWNRKRAKAERRDIDVSWGALKDGALGPDRLWRHMVTIEDAERQGCDLFDLAELRDEYSVDQFANLLMCEFIDDTQSVFPLSELKRCMVDAVEVWDDFDFAAQILGRRPFGRRPVWLGYDPADTGDTAAVVVVAPPDAPGGRFRCLDKFLWRGMDFPAQAKAIRELCGRYNVVEIGIDATGVGIGVFQLVRQFFPRARQILYDPLVKTRLVLKAKDVVSNGRLQMDAGWTDMAQAMMSVRKTLTASGRAVTYDAPRDAIGHADLFWALAHALDFEPLEAGFGAAKRSTVEISG